MGIIDRINSSKDIKKLGYAELTMLADEIRAFFVEKLSKTGGHLASNLGSIELTLAINRVYNPEVDRVLFDVGHQAYTHKIITGRRDQFDTLRCFNGLAGFPRPYESIADAFTAGHSSDSVSVALGMAKARTLLKQDYNICVVIGDGSLSGGLAYEGLENVATLNEPMVIILNDNAMSISKNVGGMSKLLQKLRVSPNYIEFKKKYRNFVGIDTDFYRFSHKAKEFAKQRLLPGNIFSELGLYYLGPIDGHNIKDMEAAIRWAKEMERPVLVHVITNKGNGVSYAEMSPNKYHGVGPFDPVSGDLKYSGEGFCDMMGKYLVDYAEKDERIVAITAAMSDGTGLSGFASRFPDRFLDVGITEGNAVAMAAGMAKQGLIPVFAVYSTFLQRGYDMLIHDVALQNLHVVFCVDRAGLVGKDGETHQGTFDIAYLSSVPGMTVLCPASFAELNAMMNTALYDVDGPVAIRYPRGGEGRYNLCLMDDSVIKTGDRATVVSYGTMINEALDAEARLSEDGVSCDVIKLARIKPNNFSIVLESLKKTGRLVVVEDVAEADCVGERILSSCEKQGMTVKYSLLNSGEGIVQHGSVKELLHAVGADSSAVVDAVMSLQ